MDMVEQKVRRVHLGTHGADTHARLLQAFVDRDFEIVFNYEPDTHYDTQWGSFSTCDGIITVRNPALVP